MKNSLTRKVIRVLLIYMLIICFAAVGAYAAGITFRQYLRIANEVIIAAGLITVLLIWNKEIPKEQKNKRKKAKIIAVAVILFSVIGLFLQIFAGIDKETVIQKDGEKKIEVERSWVMFLERSYYDYSNIFWYENNPHYTENYDDGSPDQLIYTDYYNEDGVFIDRVYTDE